MIDLRDANPVPPNRIDGWSQGAEGQATRARVESSGPLSHRRNARPARTVAVAAAVVLALVASVLVVRNGNDSTTPPARRSVVERLADGKWKRVDTPELGLVGAVTVSAGRELIVWGRTLLENAGARYDPQRNTWRLLESSPLHPRADAQVVWTGRELLVWGGVDAFEQGTALADGAAYRPSTDSWRPMATAPFPATSDATVTWTGRLLIAVNQTDTGPAAASYDPRTDSWQVLPDPPVSLRDNEAIRAAWTGREAVYFLPSGTLADRAALAFEPRSRTWRDLQAPLGQDGFGTVGLVRDRRSVAYMGWPGAGGSADGELRWARLDVARGEWRPGPRAFPHPSICAIELSAIPRGAVVFCDVHHVVGVDFVDGTWHEFPRAPGELPRSLAWSGHALFAFAGDRLLALEPAAK